MDVVMDVACEICDAPVRRRVLRGGHNSIQECSSCGHLVRDLHDSPANHRDHAYGGEPTLDRIRLELTYRALRQHGTPASVFEVGYGPGSMLRRYFHDGVTIAGADPDQLGQAVDPVVAANATLFDCGVESISPGAIHTELVFGIHVLEHVVDPAETLRVCYELLHPGGVAQFFTPAGDSRGLDAYGSAWWMLEDPTHVRFFTARSLDIAARAAGFTEVSIHRPLLDSLSTDAGSIARLRQTARPAGALGDRTVLAAAIATAPAVVAARAVSARMRPTLHLVARKPL